MLNNMVQVGVCISNGEDIYLFLACSTDRLYQGPGGLPRPVMVLAILFVVAPVNFWLFPTELILVSLDGLF